MTQNFDPHAIERPVCHCQERAALCALVDAFAEKMKAKLIEKMDENREWAWADHEWKPPDIIEWLAAHIEKGDPVDVANFAAFWWMRLAGRRR